jgi:hypothetical protein
MLWISNAAGEPGENRERKKPGNCEKGIASLPMVL